MPVRFHYDPAWREDYKRKLASAGEAVACVKSGNRVLSAGEGGESDFLLNALAERKNELTDVLIHTCNSRNYLKLNDPEYSLCLI